MSDKWSQGELENRDVQSPIFSQAPLTKHVFIDNDDCLSKDFSTAS